MKMYKNLLLLIFLFIAISSNCFSQKKEAFVGKETIKIPEIDRFVEMSDLFPQYVNDVITIPETHKVLAMYLEEEDIGNIMLGKDFEYGRYIYVVINKSYEKVKMEKEQFYKYVNYIENSNLKSATDTSTFLLSIFNEASQKISFDYGIIAKLSIDQIVPLGSFLKNNKSFGIAYLAKYQALIEGEEIESVMCYSFNSIFIKNIIINAYFYTSFNSETDIEWVRDVSKEFCKNVVQLNL